MGVPNKTVPTTPTCPPMTDLVAPAMGLRQDLQACLTKVDAFFNASSLSSKRFTATTMYLATGEALLASLDAFRAACELVEDAV